jgi:hypothetical protein
MVNAEVLGPCHLSAGQFLRATFLRATFLPVTFLPVTLCRSLSAEVGHHEALVRAEFTTGVTRAR